VGTPSLLVASESLAARVALPLCAQEAGVGRQHSERFLRDLQSSVGKTTHGVELEGVEDRGPSRRRRATGDQVLMAALRADTEYLSEIRQARQLAHLDHHLPRGIFDLVMAVEGHGLGQRDDAPLPFQELVTFSADEDHLAGGDDSEALNHSAAKGLTDQGFLT
jgi:hypothetical protein